MTQVFDWSLNLKLILLQFSNHICFFWVESRQFISVVGISVLQNIIIMGLQHLCILILLLLLGDMLVSNNFSDAVLCFGHHTMFEFGTFFSCRCYSAQVARCIFGDLQASNDIPGQTPAN